MPPIPPIITDCPLSFSIGQWSFLGDATYKFLVEYAKEAGVKAPKRTEMNDLSSEVDIAARIHGSGWVIYSVQTETTKAVDLTTIEECTIELK